MSWDVMIFNLGGKSPPPLDKLDESDLLPLGPAEEVRRRISAFLAGVDWSDRTWGLYGEEGRPDYQHDAPCPGQWRRNRGNCAIR